MSIQSLPLWWLLYIMLLDYLESGLAATHNLVASSAEEWHTCINDV